jgi:hypothetical protein
VDETLTPLLSAELLEAMHEMAERLVASEHLVLHYWGLHLLNDLRGLSLLAEKYS